MLKGLHILVAGRVSQRRKPLNDLLCKGGKEKALFTSNIAEDHNMFQKREQNQK